VANSGEDYADLPSGAHAIAALGAACARLAYEKFEPQRSLFASSDSFQQALAEIAMCLRDVWTDEQAALLFEHLLESRRDLDVEQLNGISRWVQFHPNDAASVIDCLSVAPPPEISITRLLSRAGSQKLVFLATWQLTQRQVVIKKLIASAEEAARITQRELEAHPLKTEHPHIISTHILSNGAAERFLVEEYLPIMLNDAWRASSIAEVANLLVDIGEALHHLHANLGLIHGDVKPDNIGMKDGKFILLDFGICRKISDFSPDATATGSIRTRAPEILAVNSYSDEPTPIDIWALAATAFKAVAGRFPLIDFDEPIPRVSSPAERSQAESKLAERAADEWDRWVDLELIEHPALRAVLEQALAKAPHDRPSANNLVELVKEKLTAFVRDELTENGHFTPVEEWAQIDKFLLPNHALMPTTQRTRLAEKLRRLMEYPGFSPSELESMRTSASKLGADIA